MFKSKAHAEKIKELEASGKVPKGTYEDMKAKTKGFEKLPERVKPSQGQEKKGWMRG